MTYFRNLSSLFKIATDNSSNLNSIEIIHHQQPTNAKAIWLDILSQSEADLRSLNKYLEDHAPEEPEVFLSPELQFLEDHVFPVLLPILDRTLHKAVRMECLTNQKSLFNGIDYIAEQLYNKNELYPDREQKNLNIFLIPWVEEYLKTHPRPIFPKSWIYTKDQAARIIQAYVRGHFVRKHWKCQEMRQFWKIFRKEALEKKLREQELSAEG